MTILHIGIDTGTRTGFAVWNAGTRQLEHVATMSIDEAMQRVRAYKLAEKPIKVWVEDARKASRGRKGFGNAARAQGAGSIKRDAAIWEGFLKREKIDHELVRPTKALTKWPAEYFAKQTGYTGKTSEHARDAAMIVWQR